MNFWKDETSKTVLHELPVAVGAIVLDKELGSGYIREKIRRESHLTITDAYQKDIIDAQMEEWLRGRVEAAELSTEELLQLLRSYMSLVLGYVGISASMYAAEFGGYMYSTHTDNPALVVGAAYVGTRLARPAIGFAYTYFLGRRLGIDSVASATLSAIPTVGPALGARTYLAQLASYSDPALGEIQRHLAAERLASRMPGVVKRLRPFQTVLSRIDPTRQSAND